MKGKIRILTFGRLGKEFQEALKSEFPTKQIEAYYYDRIDQETLNNFEVAASFSIDPDLDISHLNWIHSFGAGVNPFVSHPHIHQGVRVSRTIGKLGEKIAEYCLGYILAEQLNVIENQDNQKLKV